VNITSESSANQSSTITTIPFHFPQNSLSEHELMLIQSELTASYTELKKIFRFYATNETASGYSMDKNDTILFLTDCKLINNGKMKFSTYEDIFSQCTEKLPNNRTNWNEMESLKSQLLPSGDDKSEENKSSELTANRFVSFILSIASLRYSQAALISDRLAMLLRHYVLKNARKLDSETFHLRIRNGEMSDIFRQYRKRLRRIFLHLANQSNSSFSNHINSSSPSPVLGPQPTNSSSSSSQSTATNPAVNLASPLTISITLASFIGFLRASKLVDTEMISLSTFTSLCRQVCYGEYCVSPSYLFLNTTTPSTSSGSSATPANLPVFRDIRLEFVHFTEALTALAVFRYPDPYTPMHRRVENFLSRDLNVILK
jgi:hypothetical protein